MRYWSVNGQTIVGNFIKQSNIEVLINLTGGGKQIVSKDQLSYKDIRYLDVIKNQDAIVAKGKADRAINKAKKKSAQANVRYRAEERVRYRDEMYLAHLRIIYSQPFRRVSYSPLSYSQPKYSSY